MDITLQKIDLIRKRTDLNYQEARKLLEEADGDVTLALDIHEQEGNGGIMNKQAEKVKDAMSGSVAKPFKKIWQKGVKTSVRVRGEDGVLLEFPAVLAIAGALFAPRATAIGAVALLLAHYTLEAGGRETETLSRYAEEWAET